jgi:hypothetical protein
VIRERRRRPPWAVWLACLALALNALVPIHLALDLGEELAARHGAPADARHGLEWRLFALATGHDPGDGRPDGDTGPDGDGHRPTCPVFAALGALGGLAIVAAPVLPLPAVVAAPPLPPPLAEAPRSASALAYRSRAPPFG